MSPLINSIRYDKKTIAVDEWLAFNYLMTRTVPDSVILANRSWGAQFFVVSGLTGRVAYLEDPGNPVGRQAQRLNRRDNRTEVVAALRKTRSNDEFCNLLWSTPITHLFEFQNDPWPVHPPACLNRLWESPKESVIIWQMIAPRIPELLAAIS